MPFTIGIALALVIGVLTTSVGLARDRGLYSVVLIVVAHYYVLFALMGESTAALVPELIAMGAFVVLAVLGFTTMPWLIVAGLAGHGVFDALHPALIANPGVPAWWPGFCAAFDVTAAVVAAAPLLLRWPRSVSAQS